MTVSVDQKTVRRSVPVLYSSGVSSLRVVNQGPGEPLSAPLVNRGSQLVVRLYLRFIIKAEGPYHSFNSVSTLWFSDPGFEESPIAPAVETGSQWFSAGISMLNGDLPSTCAACR